MMLSNEFRVEKLETSLLPDNCQCKTTDMWLEGMVVKAIRAECDKKEGYLQPQEI